MCDSVVMWFKIIVKFKCSSQTLKTFSIKKAFFLNNRVIKYTSMNKNGNNTNNFCSKTIFKVSKILTGKLSSYLDELDKWFPLI